ncbi:hypothetical protein M4D79_21865 [Mycolicibacterium novocastrense]|nr:hypothetical protein M4D79_21865 [Mycolicibacterium novocastrense]
MSTLLHRGEADFAIRPDQGDDIESQIVFIDPILVAVPKGIGWQNEAAYL